MAWKVFWMEPVDRVRVELRRFTFGSSKVCRARSEWGHDASLVIIDDAPLSAWLEERDQNDRGRRTYRLISPDLVSPDDPRWPQACEACGEPFQADDEWQVNARQLHSGSPDGRLYTLHDCSIGAMWDAWWMSDSHRGPDGIALCVKTPGGDWLVDGQASNCTRTQEVPAGDPEHPTAYRFVRSHYCWIRHGDPRTGNVHVDKDGDTCAAGAGSILIGKYHGFLHNGYLTDT
jgi:hypothetical protein